MKYIGVCGSSGALYEGEPSSGFHSPGSAVLLPIEFIEDGYGHDEFDLSSDEAKTVFKEDFFDPITKVRRGRVYKKQTSQTQLWSVHDPNRNDLKVVKWRDGTAQKIELITYQKDSLSDLRNKTTFPMVILGAGPFISIWKIISIESSFNGIPILTLRSFRSFGVVPEIIHSALPEQGRNQVLEALEKVENSSNRLGPVDVVDRCRDALSAILGHYVENPEKDLSKAISGYMNKKDSGADSLVSWAGKIVARLHARGKPNEQERLKAKGHKFKGLEEEDAQLALRCLWLVLVEIGWANGKA